MHVLRRSPQFRGLWLGQVVSVVGDGAQSIALLWWAKHHGGNSVATAVLLSIVIPSVAGGPIGGWLADRASRRTMMLTADLVRAVLGVALGVAIVRGWPLWTVCTVAAAMALAGEGFSPAYSATVPMLVADADLPAANGLNLANSAMGSLAGPIIGGLLLTRLEPGWLIVGNAATFLWSACWVYGTTVPAAPRRSPAAAPGAASGGHSDDTDVGKVVRSVGSLVGLAAALNLAAAPLTLLTIGLIVDHHRASSVALGLFELGIGAGMLVGSLLAARLAGSLAARLITIGGCIAVIGNSPLAVAIGVAAMLGVCLASANATLVTRLQRSVPREVHGRVFGILGSISEGLRPLGTALAPVLLTGLGVTMSFTAVGGWMVGTTTLWLLTPSGRRHELASRRTSRTSVAGATAQ